MARHRGFSLVGLVVTAAIAVPSLALVMKNTLDSAPQHKLQLTSASGAVSISNSQEGQAILQAQPMLPGQTSTGTVRLANTGDGPESLVLDAGTPVDRPGPGGGHLSVRLRLRVDDVTSGSAQTVYDGALTGLHLADLGTWQKDESRTYRFVVSFPDGGANGADNAYQGSSASIAFTWTAGAAGPSAPPADAPYDQQVAADDPLGYWPLDGSQASMGDAAGNHSGQFSNSVTTADVPAPGGGNASSFDGTTSYGYVPSLPAPTHAYTVEVWVRPADTNDALILDHGAGPALGILDGHFVFRQTDKILTSSTTVEPDRWWHLVGTWDATTGDARLYVDGHLSDETTAPTAPSGAATLYIGRGSWTTGTSTSSEFFHGDMAQVSYYGASLAPDRVEAHFKAGEVTQTAAVPSTPSTPPGQSDSGSAPPSTPGAPPSSGGGTAQPPASTPTTPNTCPKVSTQGGSSKKKPAKKKPKPKKPKPKKKPAKRPSKGHAKPKHKTKPRVCVAPTARANKAPSKRSTG